MKIDSNQFINIKMIYKNLGSEIFDVIPELYAITGCATTSYKYNIEKFQFSKKIVKKKVPPVFSFLIKMLRLRITLTEKLSKRRKIFVQIMMYNGKLNKNYLSTRVRLYKKLKPKSSMPLLPHPHSFVEEKKRVHKLKWSTRVVK